MRLLGLMRTRPGRGQRLSRISSCSYKYYTYVFVSIKTSIIRHQLNKKQHFPYYFTQSSINTKSQSFFSAYLCPPSLHLCGNSLQIARSRYSLLFITRNPIPSCSLFLPHFYGHSQKLNDYMFQGWRRLHKYYPPNQKMECLGQSLPAEKLKQNCRDLSNIPQCPQSHPQEHPFKSNKQVQSRSPPSQPQVSSNPNPKIPTPQNHREPRPPNTPELVIFRRHEYESKSFTQLLDLHSGIRTIRSQAQIKYTLSDFNQIANFGSFMVNVSSIPAKSTYKQGEWKALDQGKLCNCERSECLQKYCVCYQKGKECSLDCLCKGCKNDNGLRKVEKDKRSKRKEKEEEAGNMSEPRSVKFKKSIEKLPHKNAKVSESICRCRKQGNCLKSYCGCHRLGINCSRQCQCLNCKN